MHGTLNILNVCRVRPKRRWEDNIKMDLKEAGWEGGGAWTGLFWFRIGTGGGHQ